MKFFTKYNRPVKTPEKNSGQIIVERAGYVSAKKRIEDMIDAGQRLVDYRKSEFDFPDGKDTGFNDPTRNSNFDLVDAHHLLDQIESKKKQEKKPEEKVKQEKPVSEPDSSKPGIGSGEAPK